MKFYTLEELIGKQVLAVTNFPPQQIANFMSEVLALGVVVDEGEIVLIQPDHSIPPSRCIL
jgi:tRNA-binding protein